VKNGIREETPGREEGEGIVTCRRRGEEKITKFGNIFSQKHEEKKGIVKKRGPHEGWTSVNEIKKEK